jgi:NAD(P)-dependent dehydrogenase (short-subunit alcohol dehydrogenase family)
MSDALFSVAGQVVVVSGGSRGIGHAIAQGFAERSATVITTGRDPDTLERSAAAMSRESAIVHPRVCDVARASDITSLVDWLLDKFGRVDTLINVAGVNRRKPALELTEDDYDFVLDTNLKGAFLLSQAIGKQMIAQGSGCQINIASLNTDRPLTHVLPYAISKAGIAHMTRALALEWGPSGVRVNAIAPGFILTDLTRQLWSNEAMLMGGRANTPLKRLGQPADLVGTAIFLASPAAAFVTGQIVYVDGGFTAGWAWPIPPGGGQS